MTGEGMPAASAAFANDVDLSVWEMAVNCGSCHVGGSVTEFDRDGVRHSQRPLDYMNFDAYQNYVLELFDANGLPVHYNDPMSPASTPINGTTTSPGFGVAYAMWSMPGTFDNKFTNTGATPGTPEYNAVVPSMFVNHDNGMPGTAQGWAPDAFVQKGMAVEGQMMMPNVREMDCFYCHLSGFNNIISSVAVQMGYLNAAPSLSSGLMNMFTQTYNPGTTEPTGAPVPPAFSMFGEPVKLSAPFLTRLNGEPKQENCRQCHTPTTMENFSAMFDEFLAAAPMDFNPDSPNASLINGMVMPDYDLNAPFVDGSEFSDPVFPTPTGWVYDYATGEDASGPFGLFPMALDMSTFDATSTEPVAAGGNKPGMSGPLYYVGGMTDQNANKKSTIPFPRADFFKRGDLWDNDEQEVHFAFGCAGCHYNTESSYEELNQCDPGRGRTRMGGVESAQTLGIQDTDGSITVRKGIDTHDTVKSCRQCHLTGVNTEGKAIETFGAPNPNGAHADAGLLAAVTTARGLDASGNEIDIPGSNHMDVMDCTVCHLYKEAMTVRSLDSTSGNRYPAMIGYQQEKGMMAMFTDPMYSDDLPYGAAEMIFTQNMTGMGATPAMISYQLGEIKTALGTDDNDVAARFALKNPQQRWEPIYGWHANTPKYLPLADGTPGNADNGAEVNPDWRRVLVPINFIVAQMWDDAHDNAASDANGDNAETNPDVTKADIQWDPPIQRDMKAGMNFGAGPFGTIPVGFGGESYASAYNMDFTFSGAFQFVGVYGSNIMLTTPEEISAYKAYREGLFQSMAGVPGVNRSWANTQLVFQGGNPFQVTHNVVETEKYAKGKKVGDTYGCTDCHDAGAGFFSGAYDMTGTGVPAQNKIDLDGPEEAFGPGMGYMFTPVDSNMMMRPVVDFEVVAEIGDLRTGSEAKDKTTGAVLDVEFEQHGCWDKDVPNMQTMGYTMGMFTPEGVTITGGASIGTICGASTTGGNTAKYVQTTDLGRDEFMYPALAEDHGALATKIAELESITPEQFGLGLTPEVESVIGSTDTNAVVAFEGVTMSDGVNYYTEVVAGTPLTMGTTSTGGFSYEYYWENIADVEAATYTGASQTLSEPGTYRIVTIATNIEGKITKSIDYVVVKNPLSGQTALTASNFTGTTSTGDQTAGADTPDDPSDDVFEVLNHVKFDLAVDDTGITYDTVLINWGDGTAQDFYDKLEVAAAAGTYTKILPSEFVAGDIIRVNVTFALGSELVGNLAKDIVLQ